MTTVINDSSALRECIGDEIIIIANNDYIPSGDTEISIRL